MTNTTNVAHQPITSDKANKLSAQQNFDEEKFKKWFDESFKDVDGYHKEQLDIKKRLRDGGLSGLELMALPAGIAYTAGASMWLLMVMILQIGLSATDKQLAEKFEKSIAKLVNDACNNGVEKTNFLFENIFNNLTGLLTGKAQDYVGEAFTAEKVGEVQKKMQKIREEVKTKYDETDARRFDLQTENQQQSLR